jgi:hypothetical protein
MKRCRLKRYNFKIKNKMKKEAETLVKEQNGNDFIADVSARLFGWLCPKCNHCNKGRLQKIDTYHHDKNMDIDIYRCNNCKNRVGVNAT